MLNVNWAPLVGGCVIKKEAWEKIPANVREPLLTAATRAGQEIRASSRKESAEAVAAMQKRGLTVDELSPEMTEQWRKEAEKLYPDIRGRIVPADIFDEVQKYVQEYRSSGASK
jgi:TRAP-type C4-dicarboxylate transport system substrate-binding protein